MGSWITKSNGSGTLTVEASTFSGHMVEWSDLKANYLLLEAAAMWVRIAINEGLTTNLTCLYLMVSCLSCLFTQYALSLARRAAPASSRQFSWSQPVWKRWNWKGNARAELNQREALCLSKSAFVAGSSTKPSACISILATSHVTCKANEVKSFDPSFPTETTVFIFPSFQEPGKGCSHGSTGILLKPWIPYILVLYGLMKCHRSGSDSDPWQLSAAIELVNCLNDVVVQGVDLSLCNRT